MSVTSSQERKVFGKPGRPEADIPNFGQVYSTTNLRLELVPPIDYEVHFESEADAITLPLGPIHVARALDSDRVRSEIVRPGTLSFHPAGTSVFARTEDHVNAFISLRLEPTLRRSLERDRRSSESIRSVRSRRSPGAAFLVKSFRQFFERDHAGGSLVAESLSILALAEALAFQEQVAETRPDRGRALCRPSLERIVEKIDASLDDNIGLVELADIAGLSVFQFARAFKARTGQTPHQYVIERRIARAQDLLQRSEDTIADIAYAVGFSSQAHLTDVFKKRVGVTPGRYRSDTRI